MTAGMPVTVIKLKQDAIGACNSAPWFSVELIVNVEEW